MLDWIKHKIESLKFLRHPMKIRSYTDVIKERVFGDIDKFRSNVLNMSLDDIGNGIKLIDHMGLDCGTHREAYYNLQEIKKCFSMIQSGVNPNDPLGCFGNMYSQYQNMYAQYGFGQANSQNQYGQYNG